jgi:hypothetical protein
MKTIKQIGIWMDNSNASLIDFSNDAIKKSSVVSEFNHEEKVLSLKKNENLMHNKEQQKQAIYFKKLSEIILNYHQVLLFGPTDAKSQLYNLIKTDHRFEKIKIDVKQADKMTEVQMSEFVKEFFKSVRL